ncbi:MAG: shikimate dehydrogenase [Bacteroidota bacterium]
MFRQFGLIGKKLGHSFSKKYFSQKFAEQKIDAAYELYELAEIAEFEKLKKVPGLKGLNVTIPYKTAVIPFLDELSPEARAIQAVNTIRFEEGKLYGFNSDIYGFWDSLLDFVEGKEIEGALILGNGGATRAVHYVLEKKLGVKELKIVTRNPRSANHLSYEELEVLTLENFSLIVNTTPLGMYPDIDVIPMFPYHKLGKNHWAYDLIYNPEETSFMKAAAQHGARTKNGMDMLIGQAEKSWEFWNA